MTDGERIIKLETQMQNIEHKVEEGFHDAKVEMSKLNDKMDKFIEAAEQRFAAKWVETGIRWGVTVVLGSILLALLALIIKE